VTPYREASRTAVASMSATAERYVHSRSGEIRNAWSGTAAARASSSCRSVRGRRANTT